MKVGGMRDLMGRRQLLRAGLYGAGAVGLGNLLAACGGSSPAGTTAASSGPFDPVQHAYDNWVKSNAPGISVDLLRGAAKEGSITVYGSPSAYQEAMTTNFQRLFPFVTMNRIALNVGPLVTRFRAEAAAGQNVADAVLFTDQVTAQKAIDDGLLLKFAPSAEPELSMKLGIAGYAYPLSLSILGIVYNPKKFSGAEEKLLETYAGLSQLTGKKYALQPITLGSSLLILYTYLYQTLGANWCETASKSYIGVPSGAAAIDTVISTESDLGLGVTENNIVTVFLKGAPVRWKIPTPIVAVPVLQSIPAKAPHSNAAKLWQEYVLTPYAQGLVLAYGSTSVRTKGLPTNIDRPWTGQSWYQTPSLDKLHDYAPQVKAILVDNAASMTKTWQGYFK